MKEGFRKFLAAGLIWPLVLLPVTPVQSQSLQASHSQTAQTSPEAPLSLHDTIHKSYVELFEDAPSLSFRTAQIEEERQSLKLGEEACRDRFKEHSRTYSKQLDVARADLKKGGAELAETRRHALHCQIQNLELLRSESDVLSGHAIPTAYDNLNAKLDLLMQWPRQYQLIQASLADGSYNQRRWGDVKDIGFRQIAAGQESDIKLGKDSVDELKRVGMLPPEVENKALKAYVQSIAERVARHSDLKVPLHVTLLQSKEINAFALPGGYLYIERGLLENVDDEAQLAGVIAHELAHVTARHGARLLKRATIAGIFYQAAQVAAIVLTGGAAGIGLYYALQYGYYGLGLVLDLKLLGISRDFELEADQLGIQYAWNAGYDASGFIRFFDNMATKKGYVNGVSWFRTHPPFYQRMFQAQREILFLPRTGEQMVQTSDFLQMKKDLVPVVEEAKRDEATKPTLLLIREEGCAPPQKIEYQPGQPIEQICSANIRAPETATEIEEAEKAPANPEATGSTSDSTPKP